jgi:hypothetical protein
MNTILFPAVVLKLAPVMVTEVPTGPEAGEKELIAGCARVFNEIHINSKKKISPCCIGLGLAIGLVVIVAGICKMVFLSGLAEQDIKL